MVKDGYGEIINLRLQIVTRFDGGVRRDVSSLSSGLRSLNPKPHRVGQGRIDQEDTYKTSCWLDGVFFYRVAIRIDGG